MIREMDICEYLKARSESNVLVDLRSETSYELGTIRGAVNIPIERISELYELPIDKTIAVFCQAGEISGEFAELLADAGYSVVNLTGGFRKYLRSGILPEKGDKPPV